MSELPVLKTPSHFLTIPSTKKKIKFRPFLVQEEKILLLIKESKDANEMINGMVDVINACTFGEVDATKLSLFDIEYIFLQLRSKSIGEEIEIPMRCRNIVKKRNDSNEPVETECGQKIAFNINLSDIEVTFPDNHSKNVILEDNIGITFKYPSINIADKLDIIESDPIQYIASLIESIFTNDSSFDVSMIKQEEVVDWLNKLTKQQYQKIQEQFFDCMPHLVHTIKYKCPKCGKEGEYAFKGIADFF